MSFMEKTIVCILCATAIVLAAARVELAALEKGHNGLGLAAFFALASLAIREVISQFFKARKENKPHAKDKDD
jgi:hypothetical protein